MIPTKTYRWLAALLLIAGSAWAARAADRRADWKPASAPLLTRWAKDVSPENARPEYPRPQFVRKDWKNLNGLWEFAFDDQNEGRKAGWSSGHPLAERILVPFTFEAALSGIGKGKEVHERVWYRRAFDVPQSWDGRRIHLNFDACDWQTTVWVNGREMGTHTGGYDPFWFDITDAVRASGPQELVVAVYDPADPRRGAYQPKGKQLGSEGIWYTRTTGIWQTVWLEPVHPQGLNVDYVSTTVDPQSRKGIITVTFGTRGGGPVAVSLARNGKRVPLEGASRTGGTWTANVENCRLWSPEDPVLYDLTLRAQVNGKTVDEVKSYCAFRDYRVNNGRLTLNGHPYFMRGVLDQGYWPDGILTPPSDAAIRNDVEMVKAFGLNMARKHVKVEDPRWYYWCDRLGVVVWQDMPSSHNLRAPEAKENFVREWTAAVHTVRSHPCVVHWIPFNENWGDPREFQDRVVLLTRQLDASRPITDASGWTQRGLTDVVDAHDYSNNLRRQGVENPTKPKVVGEYGGIALPVPGHTWTQGWGYQTARDPQGLVRRVRFQTTQLFEAPNLSGFVYTQLTDVEQELNGLMTYDRIPKADPKLIAAVFSGRDRSDAQPIAYIHDWLVLGPIPAGTELRSAQDSGDNQAAMDRMLARPFLENEANLMPAQDAPAAIEGKSLSWKGVRTNGDQIDFHGVFGGQTDNAVAYAVAYVDSPMEVHNATLLFGSDDGAKVWLNGKEIWTVNHIRGVSPDQDEVRGLTLKPGRNVLVVKVAQGVGGWGVSARLEGPDGKPIGGPAR